MGAILTIPQENPKASMAIAAVVAALLVVFVVMAKNESYRRRRKRRRRRGGRRRRVRTHTMPPQSEGFVRKEDDIARARLWHSKYSFS